MVRSGRGSSSPIGPPLKHAEIEERALSAEGLCRTTDHPSEADEICVEGIALPFGDLFRHMTKGLFGAPAATGYPQSAANPVHVGVDGENIPPQGKQNDAGSGFGADSRQTYEPIHDFRIRFFAECVEAECPRSLSDFPQNLLDASGLLVRHASHPNG